MSNGVKERWTQWDSVCEGSNRPGPHRLRISPYDPERRVWVVNETFNVIDGLENHRIVILDADMNYIAEFGGKGRRPGQEGGASSGTRVGRSDRTLLFSRLDIR